MRNILCKLTDIKPLLLFVAIIASPSWAEVNNPQVMLSTEKGDIVVELFPKQAPITVDNFVK